MNTFYRTTRVFALAATSMLGSSLAFGQSTWDLDKCIGGVAAECTRGGVTITPTAYQAGASGNIFGATFNAAVGYSGIYSGSGSTLESGSTAPGHAVDNWTGGAGLGNPYEIVYLTFSQAVDLNSIASTGWTHSSGDADFQVWRWSLTGTPSALTGYTPGALEAGWVSVTLRNGSVVSGDFKENSTQSISDGTWFSSYWLITTPLSGGASNDAFKLGSISSASAPCVGQGSNGSGGCAPSAPGGVPEPTSIAMVLLAGIAATTVRRRRRA